MDRSHTIGELIDQLATTQASNAALIGRDSAVSFAELAQAADRRARQLAGLGLGKSTRLAILLPNSIEWLACAFAALKLGALVVPLNTMWRRHELEHALRFADVNVLITTKGFLKHDYLATLAEIAPKLEQQAATSSLRLPELPALRHVVVVDNDPPGWAQALETLPTAGTAEWLQATQASVLPDDPAVLFFTSGTTATPKGAVHTQSSILTAAANIAERLGLDANDRTWGYLPFFFTGGFVAVALATLSRGGAVLLQEVFDAGLAIELMSQHRATTFFAWPHQAEAILDHPRFQREQLGLRKGPGAQTEWAARLFAEGHQAVSAWGMTESGPLACCSRFDDTLSIRTGAHGHPMPGFQLRIIDPDTQAVLSAGTAGELLLRGPSMMDHYYKVARADCFDADSYFHSGDLALVDADGRLHFRGRLKDVIKSAGVNIASAEIEAVLLQHPAVQLAYVVGIPHPTRGEKVAAFIVRAQDCDEESLLAFCRQRLAAYKVPAVLRFGEADEVPILGSGKVDKGALRQRLTQVPVS